MSSGERGKPAATYKEKNPFDISRRSQTEVAAEIAQRMAAWKQARGRSYGMPSAAGTETAPRPSEAKPGQAKEPHIAAPVQPARLPKTGEPVAQRQQPASGERIPLFAIRRAMPPAPSLKQPSPGSPAASDQTPAAPVEKLKIDSLEIAAPLLETLVAEHPGTAAADAAAEALRMQRSSAETVPQAEAQDAATGVVPPALELELPAAAQEPGAAAVPDDRTPSALSLDAPVLDVGEGDASRTDLMQQTPDATGQETAEEPAAAAESASEPTDESAREATEQARIESSPIESSRVAPAAETGERARAAIGEQQEADRDERDDTGSHGDALVARWEDSVAAVSTTARIRPDLDAEALAARRDEGAAPVAPTGAEAERDEHPFSARRSKLIQSPTPLSERSDRYALMAREDEARASAAPVSDRAPTSEGAPPRIEMPRLDDVAIEMRAAEIAMADKPAADKAAAGEPHEREHPRLDARSMREPEIAAPSAEPPTAKTAEREIAVPADLAAKAASAQVRVRTQGLPRMETRIERRRIDVLRADPWIAGRRPVFPRIDPEGWDVPPPEVAARARRRHNGTGWAIGLGMLLLIGGITAPAALWRDRRQAPSDQDQVALTPPVVAPQPQAQAAPAVPPTQPQPAERQPAPQESASQQATAEPPAPAVAAPAVEAPSTPQPPASTSSASAQPPADTPPPEEATALNAIKNKSEVNPAPVIAPPSPKIAATIAPSRAPASRSATAAVAPSAEQQVPDPMVPHPFVPEAAPKPTPFHPDQTADQQGAAFGAAAGAAAVADIGMPSATAPVTGGPATIALKPSLSGQLKPAETANNAVPAPARQTVARKPKPYYPQSLDQMFEKLIDTLSEGQPVNPATKPLPPGSRR